MTIIYVKDKSGFNKFIRNIIIPKKSAFIMFYMDGCYHCNQMKPKWKETAGRSSINFVEVKSDYAKQVIKKFQNRFKLEGYPTLVVVKKNRVCKEYLGGPDTKKMAEFIRKHFSENMKGGSRWKRRISRRRKRVRRKKTRKRYIRRRIKA